MRTESRVTTSSYPSSPSDERSAARRSAMLPVGAPSAPTETGNPGDGRSSAANSSAVRAASPPTVSTTMRGAAVMVKGSPPLSETDTGTGTTRGAAATGLGVVALGLGAVEGAVPRQPLGGGGNSRDRAKRWRAIIAGSRFSGIRSTLDRDDTTLDARRDCGQAPRAQ